MLAVEKENLLAETNQHIANLRVKELSYYVNHMGSIQTIATLIAGFSFTALTKMDTTLDSNMLNFMQPSGYEEVYNVTTGLTLSLVSTRPFDPVQLFAFVMQLAELTTVVLTLAEMLHILTDSLITRLLGTRQALRGPDGSIIRATHHLAGALAESTHNFFNGLQWFMLSIIFHVLRSQHPALGIWTVIILYPYWRAQGKLALRRALDFELPPGLGVSTAFDEPVARSDPWDETMKISMLEAGTLPQSPSTPTCTAASASSSSSTPVSVGVSISPASLRTDRRWAREMQQQGMQQQGMPQHGMPQDGTAASSTDWRRHLADSIYDRLNPVGRGLASISKKVDDFSPSRSPGASHFAEVNTLTGIKHRNPVAATSHLIMRTEEHQREVEAELGRALGYIHTTPRQTGLNGMFTTPGQTSPRVGEVLHSGWLAVTEAFRHHGGGLLPFASPHNPPSSSSLDHSPQHKASHVPSSSTTDDAGTGIGIGTSRHEKLTASLESTTSKRLDFETSTPTGGLSSAVGPGVISCVSSGSLSASSCSATDSTASAPAPPPSSAQIAEIAGSADTTSSCCSHGGADDSTRPAILGSSGSLAEDACTPPSSRNCSRRRPAIVYGKGAVAPATEEYPCAARGGDPGSQPLPQVDSMDSSASSPRSTHQTPSAITCPSPPTNAHGHGPLGAARHGAGRSINLRLPQVRAGSLTTPEPTPCSLSTPCSRRQSTDSPLQKQSTPNSTPKAYLALSRPQLRPQRRRSPQPRQLSSPEDVSNKLQQQPPPPMPPLDA